MATPIHNLENLKVLAAFAHPDDEGFGPGGTLAMLAAAGSAVTLVCATNGDVGEISDPALATPETLGQVRQQELRDAMAVTGVRDVRFLGYRDSGMEGTDDNNNPSSLYQASGDEVVGALVEIMREVRPNVVITHDPSGGLRPPGPRDRVPAHDPGVSGKRRPRVAVPLQGFFRSRSPAALDCGPAVLRLLPSRQFSPYVAADGGQWHHAALCQLGSRQDWLSRRRSNHHR